MGAAILRTLAETLKLRKVTLKCLILTTYDQRADGTEDVGELDLDLHGCFTNLMYFQIAAFKTSTPIFSDEMRDEYLEVWQDVFPETPAVFEPTIEDAINVAKTSTESNGCQVFITGSLYLVGGALRVLEPEK